MANPCISPSIFHGLPWESWTNTLGRTSPLEDKPPDPSQEKKKGGVMKLPQDDMKIFGLCPERDPFTVVVCESCNMCVKPQALLHHFEMRHTNKGDQTPLPTVKELVITTKPTTKVVKGMLKSSPAKVKTKKPAKGKETVTNTTPSLPVSLNLQTSISDSRSSKDEPLRAVVNLKPLPGRPAAHTSLHFTKPAPHLTKPVPNPTKPAVHLTKPAPHLTKPAPHLTKLTTPHVTKPAPQATKPVPVAPAATKTRRAPRKNAPIKEREYDPDKHCGVITTETMKPCTWSLTCKSHPMSLRRAVKGRSKPFDQLLADHRQAKEALLKQKKNVELQNSSVMLTPPSSQPNSQNGEQKTQPSAIKQTVVEPVKTVLLRLPELSLDVRPAKQVYLSSAPQSLVVKSAEKPTPTHQPNPAQHNVIAFTRHHPKALNAPTTLLMNHKIGGLVYTNRRMQVARQGLASCLNRAGHSLYMAAHRRDLFPRMPLPGMPISLSNVLNGVSSRAAFQRNKGSKKSKNDKPKSNKKVCLTKEPSSIGLVNIQLNNFKTALHRQFPSTNRLSVPSTPAPQFHIPNILSNALKRSADTTPKTQNKKLKKKNSPVMSSVLSSHSKNGLVPNKSAVPYFRVAITNGKVDPDPKTLGLCETPKFSNSNRLLSEADLRKVGLRLEIFE